MKTLLLFCLAIALQAAACRSDVDSPSNLVGQWRLIEYCSSDKTGSCTLVQVDPQDTVVIEFTTDKQYIEKYAQLPPKHRFLGCGNGSYEWMANTVGLYLPCSSSTAARNIQIDRQTSTELVLNPSGSSTGMFRFIRL